MKKFSYEARDQSSGKIVKASVQADSESAAARLLSEQGFNPLSIKETDENAGFFSKPSKILLLCPNTLALNRFHHCSNTNIVKNSVRDTALV